MASPANLDFPVLYSRKVAVNNAADISVIVVYFVVVLAVGVWVSLELIPNQDYWFYFSSYCNDHTEHGGRKTRKQQNMDIAAEYTEYIAFIFLKNTNTSVTTVRKTI